MFKRFQDLFTTVEEPDEAALQYRQQLAIAILLLEVAKSDHQLQQPELTRLLHVLENQWALSGDEAKSLLDEASQEVDAHVSLHAHLNIINAQLDLEQRKILIRNLWQIACADGEIHHWEEHLIRRLAGMMGVDHKDFISGKNSALDSAE